MNINMCRKIISASTMSWTCKRYFHLAQTATQKQRQKPFKPVYDMYTNPIDRLQPIVQVPLLSESEYVFKPSKGEMKTAAQMFEPLNVKGRLFEFLGSWTTPENMPEWNLPEVTFIGSSNVGKSSILAAMFAQIPNLTVRTSSKPGHTRLMNVFRVGKYFNLVDMPGYGLNMPDHFENSVEAYIKLRRSLVRVFLLIDGNEGPTADDWTCVDMLEESSAPYAIVMTKIDKAPPALLIKNVLSVKTFLEDVNAVSCFPQPFLVSSINGEGLCFLQAFIAYITGHLQVTELS